MNAWLARALLLSAAAHRLRTAAIIAPRTPKQKVSGGRS